MLEGGIAEELAALENEEAVEETVDEIADEVASEEDIKELEAVDGADAE